MQENLPSRVLSFLRYTGSIGGIFMILRLMRLRELLFIKINKTLVCWRDFFSLTLKVIY